MQQIPEVSPLHLAKEIIVDAANLFGCDEVADLKELDYKTVLTSLLPGVETVLLADNRLIYRVEDWTADQLAVVAHGNKAIFEIVREICFSNVWNGEPVPQALRPICCNLIIGEKKVGLSKSGRTPGQNFAVQWIATRLVDYLSDAYSISKTRSEASEPTSAVDYVEEALKSFGIYFESTTIRDWTKPGKNRNFSLWAGALDDFLNEERLIELGLVKSRYPRFLNPWGQFARMHLSTANKHRG